MRASVDYVNFGHFVSFVKFYKQATVTFCQLQFVLGSGRNPNGWAAFGNLPAPAYSTLAIWQTVDRELLVHQLSDGGTDGERLAGGLLGCTLGACAPKIQTCNYAAFAATAG